MSFVLLGVLATNCVGSIHAGALLTAPFLYNAYGQNFYVNEFNWWFRGLTFILVFACNVTGLYGILKFKTSICKVTAYISCTVWFFVLILMMLGSRNASIVAMRNSMGTAALEGKSLSCSVLLTQSESKETSWSGICYIWGLCLLLNFQAAAAYLMMTLQLIPIDLDALEEEGTANVTSSSESQHSRAVTTPDVKKYEIKVSPEDAEQPRRVPARHVLPELGPVEEDAILQPSPSPPVPVNINSLTVKHFKPTKKRVAW